MPNLNIARQWKLSAVVIALVGVVGMKQPLPQPYLALRGHEPVKKKSRLLSSMSAPLALPKVGPDEVILHPDGVKFPAIYKQISITSEKARAVLERIKKMEEKKRESSTAFEDVGKPPHEFVTPPTGAVNNVYTPLKESPRSPSVRRLSELPPASMEYRQVDQSDMPSQKLTAWMAAGKGK